MDTARHPPSHPPRPAPLPHPLHHAALTIGITPMKMFPTTPLLRMVSHSSVRTIPAALSDLYGPTSL